MSSGTPEVLSGWALKFTAAVCPGGVVRLSPPFSPSLYRGVSVCVVGVVRGSCSAVEAAVSALIYA